MVIKRNRSGFFRSIQASLDSFFICFLANIIVMAGQTLKATPSPAMIAQQEKSIIPERVRSLLQEGLVAKKGLQDIPVRVVRYLCFPEQNDIRAVFFLDIKNSDLSNSRFGSPPAMAPTAGEQGSDSQTTMPQEEAKIRTDFNLYVQVIQPKKRQNPRILDEIQVPAITEAESSSDDLEREEEYCFGLRLAPGKYLLALAVTSLDFQKIGTTYFECMLDLTPPTGQFGYPSRTIEGIEMTRALFVKKIERMESPETQTVLHKGYFTYSVLRIFPKFDDVINIDEDLDVLFYVMGARPNRQGQVEILVSYTVRNKNYDIVINLGTQRYQYPLISQQLPLKQTLIVKTEAGETKAEKRLPAGDYLLYFFIFDKVKSMSIERWVGFRVQEPENRIQTPLSH